MLNSPAFMPTITARPVNVIGVARESVRARSSSLPSAPSISAEYAVHGFDPSSQISTAPTMRARMTAAIGNRMFSARWLSLTARSPLVSDYADEVRQSLPHLVALLRDVAPYGVYPVSISPDRTPAVISSICVCTSAGTRSARSW